jgi:translation initiation factor 4B
MGRRRAQYALSSFSPTPALVTDVNIAGYAPRDSGPARLPDKPPYTAHLGNLSYDATVDTVTEFFEGCSIINVRIIEDREQQRPKGFAYAEFADVDGLKKALELDGENFQGRTIRVTIADPRKCPSPYMPPHVS